MDDNAHFVVQGLVLSPRLTHLGGRESGEKITPSERGKSMDFSGFVSVDFPAMNDQVKEFVYVLCWTGGSREVPFYVGQTTRFWGRMDDYYWAQFSACTDFRVGEAVRYLAKRGAVAIKYKSCINSREEEKVLIEQIGRKNLLNGLPAFDYTKSDPATERKRVQTILERTICSQNPDGPQRESAG